jgi:hypothetical protein
MRVKAMLERIDWRMLAFLGVCLLLACGAKKERVFASMVAGAGGAEGSAGDATSGAVKGGQATRGAATAGEATAGVATAVLVGGAPPDESTVVGGSAFGAGGRGAYAGETGRGPGGEGGVGCGPEGCSGTCTPTETRCADKFSMQTCNANRGWDSAVACDGQACVGVACTGVCVPEATSCVNSTTIRTCQDDGTWGANTVCTGQACYQDGCTGVCVPGNTECTSTTEIRACGDDGQWSNPAPCANQACYQDACTGVCSPAAERCSENIPQVCSTSGAWGDKAPACALPDMMCRYSGDNATCAANPPHMVGQDAPFSNTTGVLKDWILGNPVVLETRTHVAKFGLIAAQNTACMVRMSLYRDVGGAPTDLVGYSTQVSPDIDAQTYKLDPVAQINIDPGTYWLMAHYSCNATAYVFDNASAPDLKYASVPYGTVPNLFPTTGVTTITTFALNHYLVVQDLP